MCLGAGRALFLAELGLIGSILGWSSDEPFVNSACCKNEVKNNELSGGPLSTEPVGEHTTYVIVEKTYRKAAQESTDNLHELKRTGLQSVL